MHHLELKDKVLNVNGLEIDLTKRKTMVQFGSVNVYLLVTLLITIGKGKSLVKH